jgi:hypothetical protein
MKKIFKVKLIFGIFGFLLLVISLIIFNTGEFSSVNKIADNFIELMYQGKYTEAYHYVDSSRISIEELTELGNLIKHYFKDAVYFNRSSEKLYKVGFKPITIDDDQVNDKKLEFLFEKVNEEWKVISVLSEHFPRGFLP